MLSLYNVICMYVLGADILVLDNQMVCSFGRGSLSHSEHSCVACGFYGGSRLPGISPLLCLLWRGDCCCPWLAYS